MGGGCGILVVLLSIDGGCLLYSQRKRKERVFVRESVSLGGG